MNKYIKLKFKGGPMSNINTKKVYIWTIALFLMLFLCIPCQAEVGVKEIINNMQETYEKQFSKINDYTIVQKPTGGMAAMAGETKIYYKKATVEGKETFKTRTESEVMGMSFITVYDGKYSWSINPITNKVEKELAEGDPSQFWKNIDSAKAKYLGEETIDGEKAYVLQVENALLIMSSQQVPATTLPEEKPQNVLGKLWISSKTWRPLRMELTIKASSEGMNLNINTTTDLKDYRQVGGILHPYQVITNSSTEIDTTGMSKEEKEEQEQAIKMMQAMMSGMGSFTLETIDFQVNTGLSDDLFDGTKLK